MDTSILDEFKDMLADARILFYGSGFHDAQADMEAASELFDYGNGNNLSGRHANLSIDDELRIFLTKMLLELDQEYKRGFADAVRSSWISLLSQNNDRITGNSPSLPDDK